MAGISKLAHGTFVFLESTEHGQTRISEEGLIEGLGERLTSHVVLGLRMVGQNITASKHLIPLVFLNLLPGKEGQETPDMLSMEGKPRVGP